MRQPGRRLMVSCGHAAALSDLRCAPRGARLFEWGWKDSTAGLSQQGSEAEGSLTGWCREGGSSPDKAVACRNHQMARVRW